MTAARIRRAAATSWLLRAFRPARAPMRRLVALVASRTRDIGNAEERDRVAEIVIEESAVGRAITRGLASVEGAWASSHAARAIRRPASALEAMPPIDRIRLASGIALVAAGTALALRFFAGRPAPLVWIVPSAVAIGAAVMLTATHMVAGRS